MEEEEEVLATVDVVLTRSPDPGGALYVLQSPLRPVDRPYNLDTCDSIDVKPRSGRVQLDLPLATGAATYDTSAAEHLRITRLSLHGKPLMLRPSEHGSLVAASFHGGALYVSPVAKVVQLRPSLGHVDAADDRRRAVETERVAQTARSAEAHMRTEQEDGEDGDTLGGEHGATGHPPHRGLQLLQTRIRRPDAPGHAQLLARRAHENAEPWLPLAVHGERSPQCVSVLQRLKSRSGAGLAGQAVSATAYLDALLPQAPAQAAGSPPEIPPPHPALPQRLGASAQGPAAAAGPSSGAWPPASTVAPLGDVLHAMVIRRQLWLVGANHVRDLLRMSPAAAGVRASADLSDAQLAQALGPGWVSVAGRLVAATTGDGVTDPLRAKVVALLKAKADAGDAAPRVRRQDVAQVAPGELQGAPTSVYTRVMRALCDNAGGGLWVLRAGQAIDEAPVPRARQGAAVRGSDGEGDSEDDRLSE